MRFKNPISKPHALTPKAGAATLSTVLMIAAIVLLIAVSGVIVSSVLVNAALNERLAAEALLTARAGAQDAMVRIVRDKDFVSNNPSICSITTCDYSIAVSSGRTADVTITDTATGFELVSVGRAVGRRKVIRAELGVDPVTGEVKVHFFREDYQL